MKLEAVVQARSVWLFSVAELNPRGRAIERNAIGELGTHYNFLKFPQIGEVLTAREENKALRFTSGVYYTSMKEEIAVDLALYRDGLIAETKSSTDTSDAFVDDMLTWLSKTFELRNHREIPIRKFYVSEVIVTMEHHLEIINPKLHVISDILQQKLAGRSPASHTELGSVAFWQDGPQTNQDLAFRVERSADSTFDQRRFWSLAPLPTREHVDLLCKFEQAMA